MNAPKAGTTRWLRIRKIADAVPGDILAWRKDEVADQEAGLGG